MKIRRIFGMLGIAAVLASCNQNEELLPDAADSGTTRVSINLTTTDVVTRAAATGVTRYICEVYEDADASGERVGDQHISADGKFALTLKKNTVYSFLFWADRSDDNYNTDNLKEVYVKYLQTRPQTEAWCGRVLGKKITAADNDGFDVTLRHAVAKVVFHNTSPLTTEGNRLMVGYPASIHATLNVATGMTQPEEQQTVPVGRDYFNLPAAAGVIVEDYVFAPEEQVLGDMTVLLNYGKPNEEPVKTLSNVPLRMNYVTRITGAFSNFQNGTFTVSSEVEDFNDADHNF